MILLCPNSSLAQLSGIGFGLSISGAIFVNKAIDGITALLPDAPSDEIQLALAGTSTAYFNSLSPEIRAQTTDIIIAALQKVFIPVYVGAALALVLSVSFTVSRSPPLLKRESLLTPIAATEDV